MRQTFHNHEKQACAQAVVPQHPRETTKQLAEKAPGREVLNPSYTEAQPNGRLLYESASLSTACRL